MDDEAAIELTGLTKIYRQGRRPVRAVDGVSLRVPRGQAVRQLGAVLEGSRNVCWSMSAWQKPAVLRAAQGPARRRDQAAGTSAAH